MVFYNKTKDVLELILKVKQDTMSFLVLLFFLPWNLPLQIEMEKLGGLFINKYY